MEIKLQDLLGMLHTSQVQMHKASRLGDTCLLSQRLETEADGSRVQDQLQLCDEFKGSVNM